MSSKTAIDEFDNKCLQIWKSILSCDYAIAREDFRTLISDYVIKEGFLARLHRFRNILAAAHGAHYLRQLVMKDPFREGRLLFSIPEAKNIPRVEDAGEFPTELVETMVEILEGTIPADDTRLIGFYLGLGAASAYAREFAIAETLYRNAFRFSMNLELPDIVDVLEHVRMEAGSWGVAYGPQLTDEISVLLFRVTLIDQMNSWYQNLSEVQQPWMHGGEPVRCRITLIWSFYDCILRCVQKREYTLAALAFSQAIANLRKIPDVLLVFFRWYPEITVKDDSSDCIRYWRTGDPFDPTTPFDTIQRETLLKYFFQFQLVAWRGQFIHLDVLVREIEKIAGSSIKESLFKISRSLAEQGFENVTLSPGEFRSWTYKLSKHVFAHSAAQFSPSLSSEEKALIQIKHYILERWSLPIETPRVSIGGDVRAYRMIRVISIADPKAFDQYFTPEHALRLIEVVHSLNGNPMLDLIVPPGDACVTSIAIILE